MRNSFVKVLAVLSYVALIAACSQESSTGEIRKNAAAVLEPVQVVMVVYNAVIYTVNPDQPVVEAMAFTTDGEILRLGTNQKIQSIFRGKIVSLRSQPHDQSNGRIGKIGPGAEFFTAVKI